MSTIEEAQKRRVELEVRSIVDALVGCGHDVWRDANRKIALYPRIGGRCTPACRQAVEKLGLFRDEVLAWLPLQPSGPEQF